ncbi:hypothetical protein [Priestia aryabhattai]
MLRKGVKIFKFINQRSALDVTQNLEYFKEKTDKDEYEYKGNIVISITSNKQYLKAYISKSKAKSLFQSIIDGNFTKLYPKGFIDYGGSIREGKVIARTLKIEMLVKPDNNDPSKKKVQIVFTISEGPGQKTSTGAYKPVGKSTVFVQSYLDPISMRECALEVSSYIQSAEIAAQLVGKPLHTFTAVTREVENEIGIQSILSSTDKGLMSSLNDIPKLTNDELKVLMNATQAEYKKRVEAYSNKPAN